jgi:hypothetical protein
MDPYLETRWSDVHATLTASICESLQPQLPARLRARSEERILLDEVLIGRYGSCPVIDRFVKIIDVAEGNHLVTAILVLAPLTKSAGEGGEEFYRRLDVFARDGVSTVAIDLLRGPPDRHWLNDSLIPREQRMHYLVGIRRAWAVDRWEIFPVSLREPIRPHPVPLRRGDMDVVLELQPLIRRAYLVGGHDDIDYTRPPEPPLSAADEAWADELLRMAGRR